MLTATRADLLLRVPYDQLDGTWGHDVTDADLDEPIAGNVVYPCCPICHAPRQAEPGYPSCQGAAFPYIAGEQAAPPVKPRPEFCRLYRNERRPLASPAQITAARRFSRVTDDHLQLLHTVYVGGASFDEIGGRYWRRFGYASARSCADAVRQQFTVRGWSVRRQGRPRKAA